MKKDVNKTGKKAAKKRIPILMAVLFALSALFMSSCGQARVPLACTDSAPKSMFFEADNAAKGGMVMTGSLDVAEGELLEVIPALTRGMLKLEFIVSTGMDDIGHLPEINKEAILAAEISGTEPQTYEIPAGSYLVRVTVTEKAKGTVEVKAKPEE